MQYINPQSLNGARIYFTGFDHKAYAFGKSKEEKLKIIEKTLKVMLLTKNKIVFGASHLKSDLAKEFINKNPEIFEKSLVIPALRNEYSGDLSRVVGDLTLDLSIFTSYIGWDLQENTQWFKKKILEGFENERSILRLNLRNTAKQNINKIVTILKEKEYFDREVSENIIPKLIDKRDFLAFRKYQSLVYNLSGARVVNCQSALDQENMLFDYSLSDIKNRKIFLSEVEVFHRIFIDQVFKILEREKIDFFSKLSFKDIIDLREKIENSNFILKYNSIIEKSTNLIQKQDYIDFYSCSEIIELAESIRKEFYEQIDKDAENYVMNKEVQEQEHAILTPITKLIFSFTSLGTIQNFIDNTKNIIFAINGIYNYIFSKQEVEYKKLFFKQQQEIAKSIINKTNPELTTSFIDIFKLLQDYYLTKYVKIGS